MLGSCNSTAWVMTTRSAILVHRFTRAQRWDNRQLAAGRLARALVRNCYKLSGAPSACALAELVAPEQAIEKCAVDAGRPRRGGHLALVTREDVLEVAALERLARFLERER